MTDSLTAQQTDSLYLGVRFPDETGITEIQRFFAENSDIVFSVAEIGHPADPRLLDYFDQSGMGVYVRTGFRYVTAARIEADPAGYADSLAFIINHYRDGYPVAGFALFEYSQTYHPVFDSLQYLLNLRLQGNPSEPLLYDHISTEETVFERSVKLFDPENSAQAASVRVSGDFHPSMLRSLNEQLTQQPPPSLLMADADWLSEALRDYPPLRESLLFYQQTGQWLLPLPGGEDSEAPFNYLVIVFLLLLASLGAHYRLVPTYPMLIMRYFTSHRFFVDDIMSYRERSTASGVFLLIQHSFFTGMAFTILGNTYISQTGLEVLYHHIPVVMIAGPSHLSLFIGGIIFGAFVQLIALLWLYLPSKSMRYFNQTLNLYTWPFHLDFILVTVMLVIHLKGGSDLLILISGILFFLIWILSFSITAFDSAKYMLQGKISYILYTFGAHLIILTVLLIILFVADPVYDLLDLVTRT